MPEPSPVVTTHEDESASEKDARLALDAANQTKLGLVLQLQLGLMHFGALFVVDPKRQGLQDQWINWLQKAAPAYSQIGDLSQNPAGSGGAPGAVDPPRHHHHVQDADAAGAGGAPAAPPPKLNLAELKAQAISSSLISKYLQFRAWGSSDQGNWSVAGIPSLYKAAILDPSRTPPTEATLGYWDVYIHMANADEKDPDKWSQVDYPPLAFGRATDDYTLEPSTEKLEGLIKIAVAYPNYPGVKDWYAQIQTLLDAYKAQHAPAQTASAVAAPATNSAISVSEVQQGDATIVTTHTNSAPVNPPPH
jgi:hypothetical protein